MLPNMENTAMSNYGGLVDAGSLKTLNKSNSLSQISNRYDKHKHFSNKAMLL
jgi:hypothetical protein